jgi:hypothetical protein
MAKAFSRRLAAIGSLRTSLRRCFYSIWIDWTAEAAGWDRR